VDASGSGFGGSFADLLKAQGLVAPDAEPSADAPVAESIAPAQTLADVQRAIVRHTRKGRGGKTVTLIEGLEGLDLKATAKQIRTAFGCGASVEDDVLVVQGDQRDRVVRWLEGEGVRRVTRG
jgi:translation initiation factor 1